MEGKLVVKNAFWIIGGKVIQSVIRLVIGMLTARYLGPANYGIINYAAALVAFVVPLMQLGMRSTIVNELIEKPEKEGETLGTALCMCMCSGILSILGITAFVSIADKGDYTTIIVCVLYSISLLFEALEMIQYWFQSKLMSKYVSVVALCSYVAVSLYKVYLLVTDKSVYWFSVSQSLDFLIISVSLIIIYNKIGSQKLTVSLERAKEMFSVSKYYIVSGMMVTVFAHTDSIMIKLMLGPSQAGYYAAAVSCAGMIGFVFGGIIDSVRPTILSAKKNNTADYESRLIQLYSVIIYFSLMVSLFICVLSKIIVGILYGQAYSSAASALKIVVWYTTFSYMGSVRNIWIIAEKKQQYMWIINLFGATVNIVLNLIMIPIWGTCGAAASSVATQIFTNVGVCWLIKPLRYNLNIVRSSLDTGIILNLVKSLKKI